MLKQLETPVERTVFWTAITLFMVAVFAGILAEEPLFFGVPVAFLLAYQLVINYRSIFYLLLIVTPPAVEYYSDSGFSTTLPTEPLMIILMFTFIFLVIMDKKNVSRDFLLHPVTIILYIHYAWIFITMLYSTDVVISLKFLLAKTWYVIAFYFLGGLVVKNVNDFKKVFWCLFIPTLALVISTLIRHWNYQFRFSEVNKTMVPWFRNHVNYAVFLALMLPFIFIASKWYEKYSWERMLLNLSKVLFLLAIYFSYTRSSWLSVGAAFIALFIIRFNKLIPAIAVTAVGVLLFVITLMHNNRYLDYAPEFSKTIYHSDFSEHMAATTTLQDVSSAERIYRWVAAVHMIKDKPVMGFGPGEFYDNYRHYAVNKFITYISRNDEHSTVHNYYLMVTVEQGFIGLAIWLTFIITILVYGQKLFNRAKDKADKNFILALTLSIITILVNISLSDLIEADKIGTSFFLFIALIVNMDIYLKKKNAVEL